MRFIVERFTSFSPEIKFLALLGSRKKSLQNGTRLQNKISHFLNYENKLKPLFYCLTTL